MFRLAPAGAVHQSLPQQALLTGSHCPQALITRRGFFLPLNAYLPPTKATRTSSTYTSCGQYVISFLGNGTEGKIAPTYCACSDTRVRCAVIMSTSLQRIFGRSYRLLHQEAAPALPNLTMKKEDMPKLPKFTPPNKVFLIDSKWDQARNRTVIRKAQNARVVGFDTESPIPEDGCAPYAPSVVQISTLDETLVWKLTGLWHLPDSLREILEGDAVKVSFRSPFHHQRIFSQCVAMVQVCESGLQCLLVLIITFCRIQFAISYINQSIYICVSVYNLPTLSRWAMGREMTQFSCCGTTALIPRTLQTPIQQWRGSGCPTSDCSTWWGPSSGNTSRRHTPSPTGVLGS